MGRSKTITQERLIAVTHSIAGMLLTLGCCLNYLLLGSSKSLGIFVYIRALIYLSEGLNLDRPNYPHLLTIFSSTNSTKILRSHLMMLTLETAQQSRVRSLCFTLPLPPSLPQVMNVDFVGCTENASGPAHCGEAKHHIKIVSS